MGRKIVVVRHGERVDFTFGDEWIENCFDTDGKYTKKNLNMPDAVPRRSKPTDFHQDCPLTQIGSLQGTLVGKGIKEESILQPGFQVYVSPALRSVETAAAILIGLGHPEVKLKVEPALFEWTGWYAKGMPKWLTPEELSESGFEIDMAYTPLMQVADLVKDEPVEEYYERSHRFVKQLLEKDDNDLLLVGHGSSLDSLTRQVMGFASRTFKEMMDVLRGVPYCGVAIAEKESSSETWKLISAASANISMRHSSASDFCAMKSFMGSPDEGQVQVSQNGSPKPCHK